LATLAITLIPLLSARAGAQEPFEGVLTTTSISEEGRMTSTVWIKADRRRMETVVDGTRVTMLADAEGVFITLLDDRRQYYVLEIPGDNEDEVLPTFEASGRTETVAGHPCAYYRVWDPAQPEAGEVQSCIASGFGYVGFAGQGVADIGSARLAESEAVRRAFVDGFTVLKMLDRAGSVLYEVTSIQRAPVADMQLVPPVGYTEAQDAGRRPPRPATKTAASDHLDAARGLDCGPGPTLRS
jgi:hypothetical protein